MQKLVVPRDRWMCGQIGRLKSHHDGRMCILGHYLASCGVPEDAMLGLTSPTSVRILGYEVPDWILEEWDDGSRAALSVDADAIVSANDGSWEDPAARERKLRELFSRHDVELEFV